MVVEQQLWWCHMTCSMALYCVLTTNLQHYSVHGAGPNHKFTTLQSAYRKWSHINLAGEWVKT